MDPSAFTYMNIPPGGLLAALHDPNYPLGVDHHPFNQEVVDMFQEWPQSDEDFEIFLQPVVGGHDAQPANGAQGYENPHTPPLPEPPVLVPSSMPLPPVPVLDSDDDSEPDVIIMKQSTTVNAAAAPPPQSSKENMTSVGNSKRKRDSENVLQPTDAPNRRRKAVTSPKKVIEVKNIKKPAPVKQEKGSAGIKSSGQKKLSQAVRKQRARENAAANSDSDSDSDTPIPPESPATARKHWSEQETRKLLEALFGPDSQYYAAFLKNSVRTFKKISRKVFNKTRGGASIKQHYGRLFRIFKAIIKFENWTGNGAQDPDVATRLDSARNASLDIPENLTAEMIRKFKSSGSYDLFESRMREDPTIEREVPHHSGQISDGETGTKGLVEITDDSDSDSDSGSDSEGNFKTPSRPSTSNLLRKSATKRDQKKLPGVPVPAFKPRVKGAPFSADPSVSAYLQASADFFKTSAKESKERRSWLQQQTEEKATTNKVKQLRDIIADPKMPSEVRDKAQDALQKYLSSIEF